MIAIRANDAAARALGFSFDHDDVDVEPLGSRIREAGLARDDAGALYVPGVSAKPAGPAKPAGKTEDLTGREADRNCWHLDEHPDVYVDIDNKGVPHIGAKDQVLMLKQGIVLSRIVRELAEQLPEAPAPAICCITGANDSNGTFRFHELRDGESWLDSNLNQYDSELVIAIESRPAPAES